MNKNKIIFLVIWIFTIIFFIVIFIFLSSLWKKEKPTTSTWGFSIWVLKDDKANFSHFLDEFKKTNENYKNTTFSVTSFSNYEEYYNSLVWAFLRWQAPDIFVLNNNDSPFFDNQILWIDPNVVNPDDFRKKFDSVFSQDLIRTIDVDWKKTDFLVWIPVWYENLWIFYNFREIKWKKLSTWSYINEIIRELKENNSSVWIWIWNWLTVYDASDIITQFFLLDWISNLQDATWNNVKSSISNYLMFWDTKFDNWYDNFYNDLVSTNKNNLDAFSSGDIQMVIWYPRMLEEIEKRWFNKVFLKTDVFPMYKENEWKLLINYNYFVMNKNTSNPDLAKSLMQYFSSEDWQKNYLKMFRYYMPAMLSLVDERLDENIKDWYNIKYKDFYNKNLDLTTFNKKNRTIYDKQIPLILDSWINSTDLFEIFRKRLLCLSDKMVSWTSLDVSCSQ